MWNDNQISYQRLVDEPVAWLTTVSGQGVPSTAPVWFFLEDDDTISVFSRDPSVRVRNLSANDRVTLHLEGDGRGGSIVVINGSATIDASSAPANDHRRFVAKYQDFLDDYGWTAAWFAENYPAVIRIVIRSIRGG